MSINLSKKLKYEDFVTFMKRYERENKQQNIKRKYNNPYKWKKVFSGKKKNEF